jgi:hypothetical protein
MATHIEATKIQQEMFHLWAQGTSFKLDLDDSVKRQFNSLAQQLGWIGGEKLWNAKWLKCFGEVYIWRAPGKYSNLVRRISADRNSGKSYSSDSHYWRLQRHERLQR